MDPHVVVEDHMVVLDQPPIVDVAKVVEMQEPITSSQLRYRIDTMSAEDYVDRTSSDPTDNLQFKTNSDVYYIYCSESKIDIERKS
ncbi:unnamed protein product [Orchesella dallaii]|uniref:Uncharacterized protein n=1 Tax=Orchesella dallaii TaxID=48710 RepID=A0ABP1RWP6_9HEXA